MIFFPFQFWIQLCASTDVPEGCVIIREHIPITNLFTCLWFNEVDRFTSRDQISFSTVRDKIMSKVDLGLNMFLDCERRNFVIQVIPFVSSSFFLFFSFFFKRRICQFVHQMLSTSYMHQCFKVLPE